MSEAESDISHKVIDHCQKSFYLLISGESLLITFLSVMNLHGYDLLINKTKVTLRNEHGECNMENACTKLQHVLIVTAAEL